MDSASEKFPDSPAEGEAFETQEQISATLNIWVDKLGNILYNMDWEEGEKGILALSQIFYEICINGYGDLILSKMKEQCVLNNTELEFESFVKLVRHHDETVVQGSYKESNSRPVVSPDKSAYTI